MDIGNSKMVEMCGKWDPVCRVFWKKKSSTIDTLWPKPVISKMIKWPEAETVQVELWF